ncbi:MAG: FAD-dependent monooxygenase [Phyllobacterium sp.]|uniref:FAD-dependent monooxygenase n=1 Tax=Phyllobacterium sp. TaxID=1871046 RepID=UPI0030F1116F
MRILIVGAGIAGLAAAKALELNGLRADVVERSAAPPTSGQGIFLLGNASRALADLGVLKQVERHAFAIRAQRILSSSGEVLNAVATEPFWESCGPCLALPRRTLLDVLLASLRETEVSYGKSVMSVEVRGNVRTVQFEDGRISEYDLVIGADGIRSLLREGSFIATSPRSLGLCCWRMVVGNLDKLDSWTAMLGKKRTALAIPLSASDLYVYADCSASEFGDGSVAVLKKLFADFGDPLGPIIASLTDQVVIHRAKLEEVPADRFIADRLVLVGDAAHASSPSMAQGAAVAVEDAIALAGSLATVSPIDGALDAYYRRRKARVEWVQHQCHARDRLRGAPDIVRNFLLRHVGTALYKRSYAPLVDGY